MSAITPKFDTSRLASDTVNPAFHRESHITQDTLSQVLRSIHLRGAIYFNVEGAAPWVAEVPPACEMAAVVMPGADHVMAFHIVTQGACWAAVVGQPPVRLERGDIAVFALGDAHGVSSAPGLRAGPNASPPMLPKPDQRPLFKYMRGDQVWYSRPDGATPPDQTRLVCGFFGCDARPFNPLLASLPPLMHIRAPDGGGDGWLEQFIRFAALETDSRRPGSEAVLERLSEMMFVDLIRRHLDQLPEGQTSWLAGLRDRFVGRALSLLHEHPAAHWTIDQLAEQVGLSRSALHERFMQFIGQPPMQYLSSWRMQHASELLTQSHASVASVALDVGYESEAAFCRAFKRATGLPPARWRRRRADATPNKDQGKASP